MNKITQSLLTVSILASALVVSELNAKPGCPGDHLGVPLGTPVFVTSGQSVYYNGFPPLLVKTSIEEVSKEEICGFADCFTEREYLLTVSIGAVKCRFTTSVAKVTKVFSVADGAPLIGRVTFNIAGKRYDLSVIAPQPENPDEGYQINLIKR